MTFVSLSSLLQRALIVCSLMVVTAVHAESASSDLTPVSSLERKRSFTIPNIRGEEVWRNLKSRLRNGFESNGLKFRGVVSAEQSVDEYFDSSDLTLTKKSSSISHHKQVGEKGVKSQLIQILLAHSVEGKVSKATLPNEINFEARGSYNESGKFLERVKKAEAARFVDTINDLGLDPYELVPIMTIRQELRKIYFRKGGEQFLTVTLAIARGSRWPFRPKITQLELVIDEKVSVTATETEQSAIKALQEAVIKLAGIDTGAIEDSRPKVSRMFDDIFGQWYGPYARIFVLYPSIFPLGVALALLLIFRSVGSRVVRRRVCGDCR